MFSRIICREEIWFIDSSLDSDPSEEDQEVEPSSKKKKEKHFKQEAPTTQVGFKLDFNKVGFDKQF